MIEKIKKIFQYFLFLIFVKKCLICNKIQENILCMQCFKKIKYKNSSCPKCNTPNNNGAFCCKCKIKFSYKGIMIAGDFKDENLSKLIKLFKYNFIKELGQYLGLFLLTFFENNYFKNPIINSKNEDYFNSNNSIIIPVPLSNKRQKWRGFNQSYILAEILNKKTKISIFKNLVRTHRKSQSKLNKKERDNNLKNCFKILEKAESLNILKNKKVIIVDDVFTTGSTIEAISLEIKKYQAEEIWGLVLAHG